MKKLHYLFIALFSVMLYSCGENEFSKDLTIPQIDESQIPEELKEFMWEITSAHLNLYWDDESSVNQKDKADGLDLDLGLQASKPFNMPEKMARRAAQEFRIQLVGKSNPDLCVLKPRSTDQLTDFFAGRLSSVNVELSVNLPSEQALSIFEEAETLVPGF